MENRVKISNKGRNKGRKIPKMEMCGFMKYSKKGNSRFKFDGGLRMTRTSDLYFIRVLKPNLTFIIPVYRLIPVNTI